MDIYIFRHGDTSNSKNFFKRFYKQKNTLKLPILPEGRIALKKMGNYLKNIHTDANFTSPFLRCRESSQIISQVAGKKFVPDARIAEFEGDVSFKELTEKVNSFLDDMHKHNYSSILICTHGAVIAAIKHFILHGYFYRFQLIDYPSPGKLLILKNKKITEINFN
jgi:broad specificity phosphatase PhoE